MSLVEVGLPSPHHIHFNEIYNNELRRDEPDFIKEMRDQSQAKLPIYLQWMARYYNSKVKIRSFRLNNLVLRRVFLSTQELGTETLGPNWESLYRIKEKVLPGTYKIEEIDRKAHIIHGIQYIC